LVSLSFVDCFKHSIAKQFKYNKKIPIMEIYLGYGLLYGILILSAVIAVLSIVSQIFGE
jgi:hypothetical protein